jgi:hypothetical protein
MQFAKVFDIKGTQVLCLLQPRDEDGLPELKMVTYVGTTCVVFGNRLVPLGTSVDDPGEVLAKTRQLFEGFGQAEAEQAYEVAQRVIAEAARERSAQADEASHHGLRDDQAANQAVDQSPSAARGLYSSQPEVPQTDSDFGVPIVSRAVH